MKPQRLAIAIQFLGMMKSPTLTFLVTLQSLSEPGRMCSEVTCEE